MTFEQPKHLKRLVYRIKLRGLGRMMLMYSLVMILVPSLLLSLQVRMGHPVPLGLWLVSPFFCVMCWAALGFSLRFEARSRRFLEFRQDNILLSSKGEYPIRSVTGWSLAPFALDPQITVLRISLTLDRGIWMKEVRPRKRTIMTTPLPQPRIRPWSMLLDDEEQIASLRAELSARIPNTQRLETLA